MWINPINIQINLTDITDMQIKLIDLTNMQIKLTDLIIV